MNKKRLLVLGLASILTLGLASCGYNEDENFCKQIVKKAASKSLVSANGVVVSDDSVNQLGGKQSPSLYLTTKQTAKYDNQERQATVEWSWDTENELVPSTMEGSDYLFREHGESIVKQTKNADATHDVMYVRYPVYTDLGQSFEFHFKATVSYKTASQEVEYTVILMRSTIQYDEMSLEEIYAVDASGHYTFLHEEDDGSLKISPNHDQDYLYVTTRGVITYTTPDLNYSILQAGNYAIELYQFGMCSDSKVIEIGDTVSVSGEIACYYGTVQMSYLSLIDKLATPMEYDHSEPDITAANMAGDNRWSAFSGQTHRIYNLKNVTYNGNVKDSGGAAVAADKVNPSGRFTFEVKDGDIVVTIAFDYHTNDKNNNVGVALKNVLKSATVGSTKLNIRGWLRFSGPDTYSFSFDGAYQLVPTSATDVVAK